MNSESTLKQKLIAAPYIIWVAIFVLVPVIMVVYYAFTNDNGAFTLSNIGALGKYSGIFLRSILYGILATLICLVIAYPFAYIMSNTSPVTQRTMMMLLMIPMWMNFLIRTYSWMTILEDTGLINSLLSKIGLGTIHMINTPGAVILGMVYNFLPYMVLPIYTVMTKMDKNLIEASRDLGCNGFQVFEKIIVPLSMPGIMSGITMVFVPSVSTFYISQKLGGGTFDLIGDVIERQFQSAYNYNLGASLSLVLMILILLSMAVMNKFTDDERGGLLI